MEEKKEITRSSLSFKIEFQSSLLQMIDGKIIDAND
jgi:hypothetical protein